MVAAIEPLLWKAPEAARALALSERTLWTMANTGQIPSVRQGRAVRYDPADLRAWIKRKKTETRLVIVPSSC